MGLNIKTNRDHQDVGKQNLTIQYLQEIYLKYKDKIGLVKGWKVAY